MHKDLYLPLPPPQKTHLGSFSQQVTPKRTLPTTQTNLKIPDFSKTQCYRIPNI